MRMLIDCVSDFDAAGWRWPHFVPRELACHCGGRFCRGEYWHDPDFLDALEALRAAIGQPLVINSGHRCALWNTHVGGAAHSMHRTIAVDIRLAGQDRFALLKQAEATGFIGFGLGPNFLHLDRRAKPTRWFYPGSADAWRT
jgi:hypothetical protein